MVKVEDKFVKNFKKDLFLVLSNIIIPALEENTPVRTGQMKRSWQLVEIEPFVYEVFNDSPYGQYVDQGTGIYRTEIRNNEYVKASGTKPITAKKKEAMSFKIGSSTFIVKSVKGMKPRKIMEVILSRNVEKKINFEIDKLLKKYFL